MATCDPASLMADGSCFDCFNEKQQRAIMIVLLQDIANNTESAQELMARGFEFVGLSDNQQQAIIAQLLCEISQE